MRLVDADLVGAAPPGGGRRKAAVVGHLGARRVVTGAGGGRHSPELKDIAAGPERGTAKTAEIEGALR